MYKLNERIKKTLTLYHVDHDHDDDDFDVVYDDDDNDPFHHRFHYFLLMMVDDFLQIYLLVFVSSLSYFIFFLMEKTKTTKFNSDIYKDIRIIWGKSTSWVSTSVIIQVKNNRYWTDKKAIDGFFYAGLNG